jgi:23S rRNA pseudouridine1911/1915/1917 synthase
MNDESIKEFSITASDKGMRLDKYLSAQLEDLVSRSKVKVFITSGCVQKNGALFEDASYRLKEGDVLHVSIPEAEPTNIEPKAMPLDIIFEDEHLIVLNKPAGLTVHPGAGNITDTLVNGLLAYCGDELSSIGGELRPGIVHRLDKDTTGLMVVAKDDITHRRLSDSLAKREISRCYRAICWSVPKPYNGSYTEAIGRSRVHRTKMAVVKGGKSATTHYQVKEILHNQGASYVECRLETGRTHQIRVHFSHHGYPLIGDTLYGGNRKGSKQLLSEEALEAIAGFNRQALHAYRLSFVHPHTEEELTFESPLPEDMEHLKAALSKN